MPVVLQPHHKPHRPPMTPPRPNIKTKMGRAPRGPFQSSFVQRSGRLGTRMRLVVRRLQPLRRQVRVDLRRAQRLVAQQLLNRAQVRAVLQKVRGEGVAERVGADVRIKAGGDQVLVELAADRAAGKSLAVLVDDYLKRSRRMLRSSILRSYSPRCCTPRRAA